MTTEVIKKLQLEGSDIVDLVRRTSRHYPGAYKRMDALYGLLTRSNDAEEMRCLLNIMADISFVTTTKDMIIDELENIYDAVITEGTEDHENECDAIIDKAFAADTGPEIITVLGEFNRFIKEFDDFMEHYTNVVDDL